MPGSLLVRPEADETGYADNAGTRIAWYRYGDGRDTILLIPTWNFVDSRVVRHQVEAFRANARVITYDARGSGESDHPPSGYRFDDHVADALAVMDATGTTIASVVAASTGTHVAALLALRHPERARHIVLIAPPMDVPGAPSRDAVDGSKPHDEPDWRTDYPAFVDWFIHACFPEPGAEVTIAEIIELALGADHAMLIQESDELDWDNVPAQLGEIRCRAMVIHGVADPTLAVEAVRPVASAVPGAELVLLDGLGHRPDISRPDIVDPIIAAFIGIPSRDG